MKLETVKSFILVILIGSSLLLSYILWTYQPNSANTINEQVVDPLTSVEGKNDETKRSLMKPTDIIFRIAGDYYGYIDPIEREWLYEDMQEWAITDFASTTSLPIETTTPDVELIFEGAIPMDMLNSLFYFADETLHLPDWSMNRLYIYFLEESKSLLLEFVTEDTDHVQTALINDPNAYDMLSEKYATVDPDELQRYIRVGEGTEAYYFPESEVRLPTYTITPNHTEPETYVNILFSNPSVVRETNSQSIGETYFTDSRQLNVYHNRNRMEYVNHVTASGSSTEQRAALTKTELINLSIEDINGHYGWTDQYRLQSVNQHNNRIRYQLYYDGYPVFNHSKLTVIEQEWTVQQNNVLLTQYHRPLYSFEGVFEFWEVDSLISGTELVSHIENVMGKSLDELEDIKVGYELSFQQGDTSSEYIELIPAWFIKENNMWQRVDVGVDLSLKGVG